MLHQCWKNNNTTTCFHSDGGNHADLVLDCDVGPAAEQGADHVHVLVLRRPDDGRPAAAVLIVKCVHSEYIV